MDTPKLIKSSGDLSLGVAIPRAQPDRMTTVLRFTAGGRPYQVELTRADLAHLAHDLGLLLNADVDSIARWWHRLSHDDRRPGALPTAELRHAG
jgi:hypothetical protein